MKRRTFLKGTLTVGAVTVAVGAGLLTPRTVLAAWPQGAFQAKTVDDALKALFNTDQMSGSDQIKLRAPDIAENGAVVPVSVDSNIANPTSVSIIVEKNPTPLTSKWDLRSGTEGFVSTRIKMGKTSKVIAVVKAGDKLYSASKEVKVTIGGCGG
ncbi:MAG: thiosulfate oxidation carrier protein SoxY [Gammaproteobacteria bacterium]